MNKVLLVVLVLALLLLTGAGVVWGIDKYQRSQARSVCAAEWETLRADLDVPLGYSIEAVWSDGAGDWWDNKYTQHFHVTVLGDIAAVKGLGVCEVTDGEITDWRGDRLT